MNPLKILSLFVAVQNLVLGQNTNRDLALDNQKRSAEDQSAAFFDGNVWNGTESVSSVCSPLDPNRPQKIVVTYYFDGDPANFNDPEGKIFSFGEVLKGIQRDVFASLAEQMNQNMGTKIEFREVDNFKDGNIRLYLEKNSGQGASTTSIDRFGSDISIGDIFGNFTIEDVLRDVKQNPNKFTSQIIINATKIFLKHESIHGLGMSHTHGTLNDPLNTNGPANFNCTQDQSIMSYRPGNIYVGRDELIKCLNEALTLFNTTDGGQNQFSKECSNARIRVDPGQMDLRVLSYGYDPNAPSLKKGQCEVGEASLVPKAPKTNDMAILGVVLGVFGILGLVGLANRRRNARTSQEDQQMEIEMQILQPRSPSPSPHSSSNQHTSEGGGGMSLV